MEKSNKESDIHQYDIITPHDFDVLFGDRGRGYDKRLGTRRYKELIGSNTTRFCTATSLDERRLMTLDIVDAIIHHNSGRFLQKVKGGCWCILSREDARKKVLKALQDKRKRALMKRPRSKAAHVDQPVASQFLSQPQDALATSNTTILGVLLMTLNPGTSDDDGNRCDKSAVSHHPPCMDDSRNLVPPTVVTLNHNAILSQTTTFGSSSSSSSSSYQYWRTMTPIGLPEARPPMCIDSDLPALRMTLNPCTDDDGHHDLSAVSHPLPMNNSQNLVLRTVVAPIHNEISSQTPTFGSNNSSSNRYQYWKTMTPSGLPEARPPMCVDSDLRIACEDTHLDRRRSHDDDSNIDDDDDSVIFTPEMWNVLYESM